MNSISSVADVELRYAVVMLPEDVDLPVIQHINLRQIINKQQPTGN